MEQLAVMGSLEYLEQNQPALGWELPRTHALGFTLTVR